MPDVDTQPIGVWGTIHPDGGTYAWRILDAHQWGYDAALARAAYRSRSLPVNALERARLALSFARRLSVALSPPQPRSEWTPACVRRLRVLRTCGRSGWIRRAYRRRRRGGCVA